MDIPEFGLAAYPEFVQSTGYDYGSGSGENEARTVPSGKLATQS
jgi:hypothetical protein